MKGISETNKKRRPGRPSFAPTAEHRQIVERMVGFGIPHKDIATLITNPQTGNSISVVTLHKHFRRELDRGATKANAKVAQSLFEKATDDGPAAVTAAIWWTKCRMGWRGDDRVVHEIDSRCGVLVAPAAVTPAEWIARAQADNAQRPCPRDT